MGRDAGLRWQVASDPGGPGRGDHDAIAARLPFQTDLRLACAMTLNRAEGETTLDKVRALSARVDGTSAPHRGGGEP